MKRICYIVGAAPTAALPSPREGDFLIAADRGYDALQRAGLAPDLIMGDFDSLGYTPEGENVLSHSPIKDDTDLILALRWAMARGWRRFVIHGALGGARLDQTVASFQTLRFLAEHGATGRLVGDGWNVTLLQNAALRFPESASGWLSVFLSGDAARGVTLRGLKYTLADEALSCDYPMGVSNEFQGTEALVKVTDGSLFVLWQGEALPEEVSV